MFDSPPNTFRFRTDPWAADYGSAIDLDDDGQPHADVADDVETSDWSRPPLVKHHPRPARIVFVDGVQQVDIWGQAEAGGRSVDAALASIAVGAAVCEPGRASVEPDSISVERILALSGGLSGASIEVPAGRLCLDYEPESSSASGREGVSNAISQRRREMERRLGDDMAELGGLVVLDGRLLFAPARSSQVVGLAKTLHELYVSPESRRLLPLLAAGQRTPVFRIDYKESGLYSWFLRLPNTRPLHHALAGIIRLETPAGIGETAAIELADLTASVLPAFASRPEHDPRAPQNLIPVGALERHLRHHLGDPPFIRRAIEAQLQRELAGVAL
jgi:hypothetical protein